MSIAKKVTLALATAFLTTMMSTQSFAAADTYLKLGDIKGESPGYEIDAAPSYWWWPF
jgi:hypothetical protein